MDSYKIQSKLGSGNFAKVYLATHLPTQQEVALKMICKKGLNIKNLQRVQREISNMKTVGSHDSIVTLIESKLKRNQYLKQYNCCCLHIKLMSAVFCNILQHYLLSIVLRVQHLRPQSTSC